LILELLRSFLSGRLAISNFLSLCLVNFIVPIYFLRTQLIKFEFLLLILGDRSLRLIFLDVSFALGFGLLLYVGNLVSHVAKIAHLGFDGFLGVFLLPFDFLGGKFVIILGLILFLEILFEQLLHLLKLLG